MKLRKAYLALAIAGAVVPLLFLAQHFKSVGFGLSGFLTAIFENPAASAFTADLVIASIVFWVAMFHRRQTAGGPKPTLYIVLNLFIGLSCALPAYLYADLNTGEE